MYLMTSTRHGVAAKEIERQTGVTYKCAWRMCHELRKLMAAADHDIGAARLEGHVEIDETLVGGKSASGQGTRENKTIVFGMLQRDGRIVAAPIPDVTNYTVEGIINENVAGQHVISTDEHRPIAVFATPTITAPSITQQRVRSRHPSREQT